MFSKLFYRAFYTGIPTNVQETARLPSHDFDYKS